MAHKKGQGSTRNGRDSNAQRRGVKTYGGQVVKTGSIRAKHVRAWQQLRHRAAHGARPLAQRTQRLLDLGEAVNVLWHTLVFCAIGYRGHFTDYSTHGWPEREYPFPETDAAETDHGMQTV